MAEDRVRREHRGRPDEQPEDQEEVAGTASVSGRSRTTMSMYGPDDRPRGRPKARRATRLPESATTPTRSGTMSAAKIAPMRYVSQRPQPTLAPMNPARTPPGRPAGRGSRGSPRGRGPSARRRATSAIVRHSRATSPSVTQPSAGRAGTARPFGSSGQDLAERAARGDDVGRQLVLGEGVAQRAGALGGHLVGVGVGGRPSRR